jgi:heme/copper-type cytochrome/quinol oxidase subunit 2
MNCEYEESVHDSSKILPQQPPEDTEQHFIIIITFIIITITIIIIIIIILSCNWRWLLSSIRITEFNWN